MSKPDFTLEVIPDSVQGGSGAIYCWPDADSAEQREDPNKHRLVAWSAGHGERWQKQVNVNRPGFLRASQVNAGGATTWSTPVLIITKIEP